MDSLAGKRADLEKAMTEVNLAIRSHSCYG